jgi:rhodanese-related sulfurtransferase
MPSKDKAGLPIWLPALLVLALVLAACGSAGDAAPAPAANSKNADGYTDISVEQLAAMLETQDVTLVNVHVPYEGEIPQTDLFIPYNEIEAYLGELPDKEAPIVLYCRSGSMSTSAAKVLAREGYENVMELDGGFNAWRGAGHELLNR